jgi:hypothetical protein
MYLTEMRYEALNSSRQYWVQWQAAVYLIIKLSDSAKDGKFLAQLRNHQFIKKPPLVCAVTVWISFLN